MKSCKNCKYYRKAVQFQNPNECTNPNYEGFLYLDVASECEYYDGGQNANRKS
jgi:hypothetical protein